MVRGLQISWLHNLYWCIINQSYVYAPHPHCIYTKRLANLMSILQVFFKVMVISVVFGGTDGHTDGRTKELKNKMSYIIIVLSFTYTLWLYTKFYVNILRTLQVMTGIVLCFTHTKLAILMTCIDLHISWPLYEMCKFFWNRNRNLHIS